MNSTDQPIASSNGGANDDGSETEQALRVERTYRRWLRLYPATFRQQHGEEMLSTLLDAAGNPPRVHTREVMALATAALRVRVQVGRRQRPSTVLEGLRVAMVTMSASSVLGHTWMLLSTARGDFGSTPAQTALSIASLVLVLAGLLLSMRARLSAAAVLLALDAVTGTANNLIISSGGQVIGRYGVVSPWLENAGYLLFGLLLVAGAGFASSRHHAAKAPGAEVPGTEAPRPWRWRTSGMLVAVAVVFGALEAAAPNTPVATATGLLSLIVWMVLVVVGVVDARAALAAAVLVGRQVLLTASWQSLTTVAVMSALTAVLLIVGLRRGRNAVSALAH